MAHHANDAPYTGPCPEGTRTLSVLRAVSIHLCSYERLLSCDSALSPIGKQYQYVTCSYHTIPIEVGRTMITVATWTP